MGSKRQRPVDLDEHLDTDVKSTTAAPLPKRRKSLFLVQYTHLWLCDSQTAVSAAKLVLDEAHGSPIGVVGGSSGYELGRIGQHNVVIALFPAGGCYKPESMANAIQSFPNIQLVFLLGAGVVFPGSNHHIRLGDVIFGLEVIPCNDSDEFKADITRTSRHEEETSKPAGIIIRASRARHNIDGGRNFQSILESQANMHKDYSRPNLPDRILEDTCSHMHPEDEHDCGIPDSHSAASSPLSADGNMRAQDSDGGSCHGSETVSLGERGPKSSHVHYGAIASVSPFGPCVPLPESLIRELPVICFASDAGGVTDDLPCIHIRGICDFVHGTKESEWLKFSTLAAVSLAKDLMENLPDQTNDQNPWVSSSTR